MIERIRELDSDQIARLKKLGHDTLSAISPPIASMVYSSNPDQLQALSNLGPDALGAMSPQLADMLYGNDNYGGGAVGTYGDDEYGGGATGTYGDDKRKPPWIILPPFPQPKPPGPGDDGGQGNEPPGDEETPQDYVSWWAFADACEPCLDNAAAAPRPYGVPFPSGDVEPPMHDHCRCELVNGIRGSCPIHGYGRRVFELSSRY
jgi:hypothetical protein